MQQPEMAVLRHTPATHDSMVQALLSLQSAAVAQGLDHVKIQVHANGSVRLHAAGKRAQMICPDAGALQLTVGFHNAAAGDAGNRSATTVQTFSAGPNGTLRIP